MSRSDLRWPPEPRRGLPVGRLPRCPPRQGGAETELRRTPRTGRLPECLVKAHASLSVAANRLSAIYSCRTRGASRLKAHGARSAGRSPLDLCAVLISGDGTVAARIQNGAMSACEK